jgi:hypothetical protein
MDYHREHGLEVSHVRTATLCKEPAQLVSALLCQQITAAQASSSADRVQELSVSHMCVCLLRMSREPLIGLAEHIRQQVRLSVSGLAFTLCHQT